MSKITTADLRLARDLRRLSIKKDLEIREKMFGAFAEAEDPEEFGTPSRPTDIGDINPTRRMSQVSRLLDRTDIDYVSRVLPEALGQFKANRRRLLQEYVRELAYDLNVLWVAKRAMAEVRDIDIEQLTKWGWEMDCLILKLKIATRLYGRYDWAVELFGRAERLIAVARISVEDLLPETEALD